MGKTSFAVIEHFNIIRNISASFLSGFVIGKEHPLGFQAAEKTLGNGVIPTVSLATHAADHGIDPDCTNYLY